MMEKNTRTCAKGDIQTQHCHGNLVVKEDTIDGHSPLCRSAVRHDWVDAGHNGAGAVSDWQSYMDKTQVSGKKKNQIVGGVNGIGRRNGK